MEQVDIIDIVGWVRRHRRLSLGTIRRRFPVSIEEAQRILAELLACRALHPEPEGESYRVRYPQIRKGNR